MSQELWVASQSWKRQGNGLTFRASRMESALVGQQTKGQTDCKVRAGYEGMEYKVRPLKMFVLLLSVHPLPHQGLFLLLPSHSSHVQLCATLRTAACQAPLPMGFSRQEYWSESPFPSPEGSSRPRNRTRVSCIAGRFSTM